VDYHPRPIWKPGDATTTLRSYNVEIPPPDKAVSEFQAALLKNADKWKLPITASPILASDQFALLGHLFHPSEPDKYPFDPVKFAAFTGGKPYALIGIIDYYGSFGCPVKIRETWTGQKINYLIKRSILEQDTDEFVTKGYNRVGAFELFLVSAKDGSLLWQANGCNSIQLTPIMNSYWDTANHEMDELLKHLSGNK
jgi:hypothetical protein